MCMYLCMFVCVCVCFVVESWWRWCDTLWHSRTSRNPAVFTVWLPGNTRPCWKEATDRKSRASMQRGHHVAPLLFEKLKVLVMKCVRGLFHVVASARCPICPARVTARPVCVNGFRSQRQHMFVWEWQRHTEMQRGVWPRHHWTAAPSSYRLNNRSCFLCFSFRWELDRIWGFFFLGKVHVD